MKFIEWCKKHIFIVILMIILFPFLFIPIVAMVLNISLYFLKVLPEQLIMLKIDTNGVVTFSEFIYYYSCFLGIEITSILSYLVYKITVDKYSEERDEKKAKDKKEVIDILSEILLELKGNRENYKRERFSGEKKSFFELLEGETKQYGYGDICEEFKSDKYDKLASKFIHIKNYLEGDSLTDKIEDIYSILKKIRRSTDVKEFGEDELKGFNDNLNIIIGSIEFAIDFLKI